MACWNVSLANEKSKNPSLSRRCCGTYTSDVSKCFSAQFVEDFGSCFSVLKRWTESPLRIQAACTEERSSATVRKHLQVRWLKHVKTMIPQVFSNHPILYAAFFFWEQQLTPEESVNTTSDPSFLLSQWIFAVFRTFFRAAAICPFSKFCSTCSKYPSRIPKCLRGIKPIKPTNQSHDRQKQHTLLIRWHRQKQTTWLQNH